jgi:tripeptide aminopeptidase
MMRSSRPTARPGDPMLLAGALMSTLLGGAPPATAQETVTASPEIQQEVRSILEHPRVRQAFQYLEENDAETMSDLRELTQIPAPPFMEEVRGHRFAERLVEVGVDSVWTDAEGNVIGLRRGRGAGTIVIAGHLDTVFPEGTDVTIRERGDTLYAPGIADDTRGLVTVLGILRAMNAAEIETELDVWFVGTVGEEGLGDLRGMKHLFREGGPDIDAFISIDGLGRNGITHAGLGSYRYRVTFRGPGGHSWGAFGLGNPAHALGRAIAHFDEGANAYTSQAERRTSYNVGRIGGGTSVNSIPFEAWMEVDMRSESPSALDEIDAVFREAMQAGLDEANAVRTRGDELSVELDKIGDRPSGEIAPDHPFIQRAIAATALTGGAPSLGRSSTDANIPIALGVPAITIGGGGAGGGAHSLGEYYLNHDGPEGIQRAMLVLLAQAGLSPVME